MTEGPLLQLFTKQNIDETLQMWEIFEKLVQVITEMQGRGVMTLLNRTELVSSPFLIKEIHMIRQ